jgi:hypothetical protein
VVLWEGNDSAERGCSTCGLISSWVVVQCRFERCGVGLLASDWARRTVEWWEGSRKVPWSGRVGEREVRRAAAWFWTSYGKIR